VVDWESRNPQDALEAKTILGKEPIPRRKIAKGEER
jgi:hypothetical protein